ncbi:MAG: glycosyltransferase [Candidatus Omnitrophota bacterium]
MIFILLPVYNEEDNLPTLLERLDKEMRKIGFSYRVIAYDDGSKDTSLAILNKYQESMPITVIGKEKNKGLGVALDSLLKKTLEMSLGKEDIAVLLDSDDTHNPEHIYSMANKLQEGFDVVIASRYLPGSSVVGVTWFRQLFSIVASLLMRVLFPIKGVKDYTCGYRGYSINCLAKAYAKFGECLIEEDSFACMAELIIKLRSINLRAVEIPITLRYDQKYGKSKMNVVKTIQRTLLILYKLRRI